MEEKRELKNKKLKLEELENVDSGFDYDWVKPYFNPSAGPDFMRRCGFQTSSPDEYASHIAQNPEHINMRYGQ